MPSFRFILLIFATSSLCSMAEAQQVIHFRVQDLHTREWLGGVSVSWKGSEKFSTSTDARGAASLVSLKGITDTVILSYVGYRTIEKPVLANDTLTHIIFMEPDAKALNDVVIIASTRGNERIESATTKVEVLGRPEMNEESTLKPGNIGSILGDYSGIQIQQSSAVSGNTNVRIQGLDGRYTQVLRDGMPLFGGYAGGFGILSIPPLDLKQIELIKGSSSTLYGGGAIGGLINLISTRPTADPELSILVNQTTLKETNLNAYYAQKWQKTGLTFFAGQTFQKAVDVNKDGFSDLPELSTTVLHPTLFFYPAANTSISLGWSGNFEKRSGGDMVAITDKPGSSHPFFEKNTLNRNTIMLLAESRMKGSVVIHLKASYSRFIRNEHTNEYRFNGKQDNYFAEFSLNKRAGHHYLVGGVNVNGDAFSPAVETPVPVGDFSNFITGVFFQDSWTLKSGTKIETGIRVDHTNHYGDFILPRIALFQKINEHWGGRAGFGMGYLSPNPLTPQTRDYSIYQIQALSAEAKAEQSFSGNAELNYSHSIGSDGRFFVNQAFFITSIHDPLVANENQFEEVNFENADKPLLTKGSDTYLQVAVTNWEFYLGYTFTLAERRYLPDHQFVLYTPRHRAATTAVYELDGKWRVGVEASYTGKQFREDASTTPGYLFAAAMVERDFGPGWSLVLNCENLFDERQSRHESLYTGTVLKPVFKTLWAPIDGRAFNICLRYQLKNFTRRVPPGG